MDFFLLAVVAGFAAWSLKTRAERVRIALLAAHLQPFEIEKLLATLSEGYQRALGEADLQRRDAIWAHLAPAEQQIAQQLGQLAARFAQVDEAASRVMRPGWPLSALIGQLGQRFPELPRRHGFDMRALLALHARAVADAAARTDTPPAQRAYTLLAELMLMQHSCHWFCKSKAVASARLLVRHQTAYDKVLDSVAPQTRREYLAIIQG